MSHIILLLASCGMLCVGVMGAMQRMTRQDFKEFQKYPYLIDY